MLNNHTMSVVTNLALIEHDINRADVTVAAITTSDYPKHPNIYNASILVPPTDILMAWADNQPLALENGYAWYLTSKEPDDMIVALIAAMTKRNIILYIPQDDFAVFGLILLNHIYFVYGITCNFMNTTFSIDPIKIPYIISKFYTADIMDFDTYLSMYPAYAMLPDFVIDKMASERPVLMNASHQDYADLFNRMNAEKVAGVPLKNMCNMVGEKK